MKEKLSLHIPKPCSENWNEMTRSQQGRFCSSCSKQVVDFSIMTDQQVLNYFNKTEGHICGRFTSSQLQRPLQPTAIESKKSWWIALLMPLLLLFDKAGAQRKNSIDTTLCVPKDPQSSVIKGKVKGEIIHDTTVKVVGDTIITKFKEVSISGKVTDENNNPLYPVSIVIKNTNTGVMTDTAGNFRLKMTVDKPGKIILTISLVGYDHREITVEVTGANFSSETKDIAINLQQLKCNTSVMGDVVFAGYVVRKKLVKKKEIIINPIRKIYYKEAFKIYPNPVNRGGEIKVDLSREGSYSIQMLDNNGNFIMAKEVNIDKDVTFTTLKVPVEIAQGMYYIRLTDEQKKKQYTDKILVQ